MSYDWKQILKQKPNAIREAILAILGVLVMTGVVEVSAEAVAGIGVVVSLLLGLFYVGPLTTSTDALQELVVTSKKKGG